SGIEGSQVQDLYFEGHADRINDYCRCDVLDTYFVFLRSRVLIGRLSLDDEQILVEDVHQMLKDQADEHPAYEHYLEYWHRRTEQKEAVTADQVAATTQAATTEAAATEEPAAATEAVTADDPAAEAPSERDQHDGM
ncbi:MAG: hypothetical protein RIK87_22755, partial [Fuerstiella sp.]